MIAFLLPFQGGSQEICCLETSSRTTIPGTTGKFIFPGNRSQQLIKEKRWLEKWSILKMYMTYRIIKKITLPYMDQNVGYHTWIPFNHTWTR